MVANVGANRLLTGVNGADMPSFVLKIATPCGFIFEKTPPPFLDLDLCEVKVFAAYDL